MGPTTWNRISRICADAGDGSPMPSYPGYVLRQGATGDAVKQIQRCLNNVSNRYASIPKVTEDGYLGIKTATSVIAFQNQFGLSADGAVGSITWKKLMEVCQSSDSAKPSYPGYLISAGSSGNFVTQIQQCLNNISGRYPSVPKLSADGVFGSGTKYAVTQFQKQFGLTADGIVGKTTWDKIMQECTGLATGAFAVASTQNGGCPGAAEAAQKATVTNNIAAVVDENVATFMPLREKTPDVPTGSATAAVNAAATPAPTASYPDFNLSGSTEGLMQMMLMMLLMQRANMRAYEFRNYL